MYCCRDLYCVKVSNVQLTTDSATISIVEPHGMYNLKHFEIHFARGVNFGTKPLKVLIQINGNTAIPVLESHGNVLYSDQLRSGKKYLVVYGNDTPHVTVLDKVCKTAHANVLKPV